MATVFDEYYNDLVFLEGDLKNNIVQLNSSDNIETLCKTIETVFDQAQELVKQAEVEARSHESKQRKIFNEKLKERKDVIGSLRVEYDSELFQKQKSQLVGKSGEDRGRMLDVNEKIRRQNEIIENCKRTVAETEEIATETMSELRNNREKIESAREKNEEFAGVTQDADKRLKSMWFRQKTWGLFG